MTLGLPFAIYSWTEYNLCDQIHTSHSVQDERDVFQVRLLPSFLSLVLHMRYYFLFDADALYVALNIDWCSSHQQESMQL